MNVYDFDKTIYKKDSSIELYKYVIRQKPKVFFKCIFKQLGAVALFYVGKISKEEYKEKFFSFLKYVSIEDMLSDFVSKELQYISEWYLKQRKNDDVIISASPEFLVMAFAQKLGIKSVIASNVDYHTGKFNGKNCYGKEKVERFCQIYSLDDIEEFYSDSLSDLPMASIAIKSYKVKGEKIMLWN